MFYVYPVNTYNWVVICLKSCLSAVFMAQIKIVNLFRNGNYRDYSFKSINT